MIFSAGARKLKGARNYVFFGERKFKGAKIKSARKLKVLRYLGIGDYTYTEYL